jgi:NDP-sugar pyrophosphorylase family protein
VVSSTPKPLASVGDRPFLEMLVRQLSSQGIRQLVFCTGYRAGEIEQKFGDGRAWNVTIEYSQELHPMGTAGAMKLSEPLVRSSSDFLVMNGDSLMEMDFHRLVRFHRASNGIATMAVFRTANEKRYGSVKVTQEGRVTGFAEKCDHGPLGFVNAGVYVFSPGIFDYLPNGTASLEEDIFPRLLDHGVYALEQHGMFIDIGTPDDYARAQQLSQKLQEVSQRQPDFSSDPLY